MHVNLGLFLQLCLYVSTDYKQGESFISSHRSHLIPIAFQEPIAILKHSNPCFTSFPCTYADTWHIRKENLFLSTE